MAWVRPTGRAGALQGEVFDKASRCKRRAREARAGQEAQPRGGEGRHYGVSVVTGVRKP